MCVYEKHDFTTKRHEYNTSCEYKPLQLIPSVVSIPVIFPSSEYLTVTWLKYEVPVRPEIFLCV